MFYRAKIRVRLNVIPEHQPARRRRDPLAVEQEGRELVTNLPPDEAGFLRGQQPQLVFEGDSIKAPSPMLKATVGGAAERAVGVKAAARVTGGSALNLNPHFHSIVADGVFVQRSPDHDPVFSALRSPTHAEVSQG